MYKLLNIVVLALCACAYQVESVQRERAVPLCLPDEKNGKALKLQDDGLDVLRRIGEDPVVVISITGPARSGKSYFISHLSDNANFEVGHGMEGKTAGIWISANTAMLDKDGVKARLVLLDTEGIGSITSGRESIDKSDTSVVSLSTLISSVMIYNSKASPSDYDLQKLYFFSMFGDTMDINRDDYRFNETLIWLVQSNTIASEDLGYDNWTSFFEEKVFKLTENTMHNDIIKGIRAMFPNFAAFALPPPSTDPEICKNLNDDKVKPQIKQFLLDINNTAEEIVSKATINQDSKTSHMTGNNLVEVVKILVDKINAEGSEFTWESLFDTKLRYRCEKHLKECENIFKEAIDRINYSQEKYLGQKIRVIERNTLSHFEKIKIVKAEMRNEFMEKLKTFMSNEKNDSFKKWAKIQFDALLDDFKHEIDRIDFNNREIKLKVIIQKIDDIQQNTLDKFQQLDMVEADPHAERLEMLQVKIGKSKTDAIDRWFEQQFNFFKGDYSHRLQRNINVKATQSKNDVNARIAKFEEQARSHFDTGNMNPSQVIRRYLEDIEKIIDKGRTYMIRKYEEAHSWDTLIDTAKISTITSIVGATIGTYLAPIIGPIYGILGGLLTGVGIGQMTAAKESEDTED